MKIVLFQSIFLITFFTLGQNHIINYHNSYSEVFGGMEDGGIQRSESYCFAVKKNIQLLWILEDNKSLELKKGDTLIINLSIYKPYNQREIKLESDTIHTRPPKVEINCFDIRRDNRKVYANLKYNCDWSKTIEYIYKKKKYTLKASEEFDSGYTGYAP